MAGKAPAPQRSNLDEYIEMVHAIEARRDEKFAAVYSSDIEFIAGELNNPTSAFMEHSIERFQQEKKPGSARFIELYYLIASLERQVAMLKQGVTLDTESLAANGLPLLVDISATTPEALAENLVVPDQDNRSRLTMLTGALSKDVHDFIRRTGIKRADAFAKAMASKPQLFERLKGLLPRKKTFTGEEAGLVFTAEEYAVMSAVTKESFMSPIEVEDRYRQVALGLISRDANMIGLGSCAELEDFLRKQNKVLGVVNVRDKPPISFNADRNDWGSAMNDDAADQLGIYPGFKAEIIRRLKTDLPL